VIPFFRRVPNVENSASSFVLYLQQITAIQAEDGHTLVLRMAAPFPLMPNYMGAVMIVPARFETAKTAKFNTMAAAIGTGPYRVVEYARGQRIVLEANPHHWAGPPPYKRVVFRPITATGLRVGALLSGGVDLIEQPPPVDIPALRANPGIPVWESVGNRIVYFGFDFDLDPAVGVTGHGDNPISNPFRDLRVRQALSLAINREAICNRVMEGLAFPANQMVAAGVFGHDPAIPAPVYDPDRARCLLAEAGYPNGFRMTFHGTSDRLVNDEKVLQALAQMFARIGMRAEVDAMLSTAFFPRVNRLEFSFFFNSWGGGSSSGVTTIRNALATYDDAKGMGRGNRGRCSNPEVDRRIHTALETLDDSERERLIREATAVAMADIGVVPSHWPWISGPTGRTSPTSRVWMGSRWRPKCARRHDPPMLARLGRPRFVARYDTGVTPYWTLQAEPRVGYRLCVPRGCDPAGTSRHPLLVALHGSMREDHTAPFLDFVEATGAIMLAPVFPGGLAFPGDLDACKFVRFEGFDCDHLVFAMFGFSGGAQFAHRFLYLYPERLRAVSLAAPGLVTRFDDRHPWWVGTGGVADALGSGPIDRGAIARGPRRSWSTQPMTIRPRSRFARAPMTGCPASTTPAADGSNAPRHPPQACAMLRLRCTTSSCPVPDMTISR
jgi:peptide/nickel transport system substrate-binding protein